MTYGAVSRRTLEWPGEQRFYLTIDFECDYGTAVPENQYHAVTHVDELIDVLAEHEIPLTTFVQTEVLDRRPEAVEKLRAAPFPVEFYPHSHTHAKRSEASVSVEVATSTERFQDFFGARPTGYRFPNGNVRPDDYELLAAAGYDFDASVFPSWRPGHFNNSSAPTTPHLLEDYNLMELPFTVLSDRLRIPTALSYCRLAGWPLLTWLAANPPSTVVFNIHMHDLFNPPSFDRLPRRYRAIYARNADGFGMLERVLAAFSDTGFTFEALSTVHADLVD